MSDAHEGPNVARYFTENRHISWVLLIIVFLWGAYSYQNMPKRKDPNIPVRVATAVTPWPGTDALTIEELVTRPVEQTIAESAALHPADPTAYGLKSLTLPGLSIVQIQLDETVSDTSAAFSDINLKLEGLQPSLPQGAGPIQFNSGFGDTAALLLTVASPKERPVEIALRARDIEAALARVRGGASDGPAERARALVVVLPRQVDPTVTRRGITLLKSAFESDGQAETLRVFQGPGFVGLDMVSALDDGALMAAVRSFLGSRLGLGKFHEDAWPMVLIGDPADTEAKLQAAAGDKYSYAELDRFTELISRSLQAVPQVTIVKRSGVLDQQVYLTYSQTLLASYGLRPSDIGNALQARNSNTPGGEFHVGGSNVLVEPSGKLTEAEEIGGVIFTRSPSGSPVYLRDIGDVVSGYQSPPRSLNYYSWRDAEAGWQRGKAISLAIQMRAGGQISEFGNAVDEALVLVGLHLPEDLILARVSNQPRQVAENIDLFMTALIEAVLLVVLISFLGFWEWRSAVLMMLSIPITLALTFGLIDVLGIELQQVSVATLIIALGLLVDDPVVAGDAIKRGLADGQPRGLAAWLGPTKLAQAILFATITNIVAYLPFLLLTGNSGDFLSSLPIVMACALLASRLVSMSFVPFCGYYLLRAPKKAPRTMEERRQKGFSGLYFRLGRFLIAHRKLALLGSFAFLALVVPVKQHLKTAFFPDDVQYIFYADVWLRNDATIGSTKVVVAEVEQIVREVTAKFAADRQLEGGAPLRSITSFLGAGAPRFWFSITPELSQPNYAQIVMRLDDKDLTPQLIGPLQRAVSAKIPGAIVDIRQLQTNPVPYPIAVRISARSAVRSGGPEDAAEIATLRRLAGQVAAVLRQAPNAVRVRDDWGEESFRLRLAIDPDRANLAGVTNQDVAASSAGGLSGHQVTALRQGDRSVPVVTILRPSERAQIADLENLYVFGEAEGNKVPLQQVASLDYGLHSERLRHLEHFRSVTVTGFPRDGFLPSEVMALVQDDLAALQASLPPGFEMEISGEQAKTKHGFRQLAQIMAISATLIFLALVFQFRNAVKPIVVFVAVPYGVVGALIALAVTKSPFGFMAFLGIVALIGVIVSHVIVLFDFIEEMREKGEPLEQALLDAGIVRLRPVLITVGATLFALVPLALHGGPLWQPLCFAQIGGLVAATFTTLLLVPVVYAIFVKDLKIIRWEAA